MWFWRQFCKYWPNDLDSGFLAYVCLDRNEIAPLKKAKLTHYSVAQTATTIAGTSEFSCIWIQIFDDKTNERLISISLPKVTCLKGKIGRPLIGLALMQMMCLNFENDLQHVFTYKRNDINLEEDEEKKEEEMNDEADKEIKIWYAPVHSNEYYQEHLKMKKEKKCLIFWLRIFLLSLLKQEINK